MTCISIWLRPILGNFQTFDGVLEALKDGRVKHALLDAYAAGSNSDQFLNFPHLKVYEILDFSSSYGIVLGGDAKKLKKCFKLYRVLHMEDLFRRIQINTGVIEVCDIE